MPRFKLTLEYLGHGFAGWQRQEAGIITVQGVLEQAIKGFSGEEVTLHCAGRTDAGVHAQGQVVHCDFRRTDISVKTVRDAINALVRPHPVAVLDAELVGEDFHARFSAVRRHYRYRICNRRAPPVLEAATSWHVPHPIDIPAMQTAADLLIGRHDFSTFRAQHCQSNSPIKTLDALTVTRDGEMILFETTARSFLYHQVRNMVGTLALVGHGQWSLADFTEAFKAADRRRGGPTAPPQGLIFLGPDYAASPALDKPAAAP